MLFQSISDWDDAYANADNIAEGGGWPDAWIGPSAAFRETMLRAGRARLDLAYGERARQRLDLFLPAGAARGLVVFIHGGYWLAFDKSYWSHYARGAVERGYAVAMPSYTLCPDSRIGGIVLEIAAAISTAGALVEGPILLAGHSAGGHLAARMMTTTTPLRPALRARVGHVLSISGLHDLRPLMRTGMNEILKLDDAEALAESPALLSPLPGFSLTCWVGGGERSEFVRQSALLANVWVGLAGRTRLIVEPDRHHFNILDGLADPEKPLTAALVE